MDVEPSVAKRAKVHAALADPSRLQIVDALAFSDHTPKELAESVAIGSNLLAHHLAVLEEAGLIERQTSAGDARRRYVTLVPGSVPAFDEPADRIAARHVLFVCRANSARSQLAAAAWNARHDVSAMSAGTHPSERVQRGAVEAAARAGLDLTAARPRSIGELTIAPDLVVTVCDVAHEELPRFDEGVRLLHWSIPDPVGDPSRRAFDAALGRIARRIQNLAPRVQGPRARSRT
jgi:protein-tyrosine-phosphatase